MLIVNSCRLACGFALSLAVFSAVAAEPLLSGWNPGAARDAILSFVASVNDPDGPDYVSPEDRIAVFDNDGTLWVEQPIAFQFEFIFERVRQLAPEHPEWADTEPYKSVIQSDRDELLGKGFRMFRGLSAETQAGMSSEEYYELAGTFLETAKHPDLDVPYTDLVYAPMLELIEYLQQAQFRVFIVSGGDIDFIRSFSESVYGIPREHVIGSSMPYKLTETVDGTSIVRDGGTRSVNVGRRKAENIQLHIGRRPIFAAGNSDGDLWLLRYTSDGPGPSLVILLDHDDAEREFAYQRGATEVLELAGKHGWYTVSMREDFRTVFPAQSTD